MSGLPDTDVNRVCEFKNVFFFFMLCLSLKVVCVCVRFCAVTVFWTRRSTGWRTIRRSAELGSWRTSMMAAALQWVSLTYHTPRSAEIIYTHMSIRLINGVCVTVWKCGGIYIVFSLPLKNVLLIGVIMWYDVGCGWIIYAVIPWTERIHLAAHGWQLH